MPSYRILTAALPPAHDAIGEYSALLAVALRNAGHDAELWSSADREFDPIEGIEIRRPLSVDRAEFDELAGLVARQRPGTRLLLQYNPFAWGRRGWVAPLVKALSDAMRASNSIRLGVMFHEVFMLNPGLRSAVMRTWQRRAFARLVRLADVNFVSTARWGDYVSAAGGSAIHLPVGSNLPDLVGTASLNRRALGIRDDQFVLGTFGSSHPSRPWSWVGEAADALRRAGLDAVVLYIGADAGDVRDACPGTPVVAAGRLDPIEAARHFAIMDLSLSPFVDGVSTRRGSVIAALQHGVAAVSTRSRHTDALFDAEPRAVLLSRVEGGAAAFAAAVLELAADGQARANVARAGRRLYEAHFAWPAIVERLDAAFEGLGRDVTPPRPARPR